MRLIFKHEDVFEINNKKTWKLVYSGLSSDDAASDYHVGDTDCTVHYINVLIVAISVLLLIIMTIMILHRCWMLTGENVVHWNVIFSFNMHTTSTGKQTCGMTKSVN